MACFLHRTARHQPLNGNTAENDALEYSLDAEKELGKKEACLVFRL